MKRMSLLIVAAMFGALAQQVSAQTADEIIAKALKASGGEAAMRSVSTVKITGKLLAQSPNGDDVEARFVQYMRTPNKYYYKSIYGEDDERQFIQATDGAVAWSVSPSMGMYEPTALEGDPAKRLNAQALWAAIYIDFEKNSVTYQYKGEKTINEETLQHIRYDINGLEWDVYFDPKSHLPRLFSAQGFTTWFSDYRRAGPIVPAHHMEMTAPGAENSAQMIVESFEVNVPVDDSVFALPKN